MAVQDPRVFISFNSDGAGGHMIHVLPATSPLLQAFIDQTRGNTRSGNLRELDATEYTAYNGGSKTWKTIKATTSASHGECP